jgi:ADP-ribosylglycohydrolase
VDVNKFIYLLSEWTQEIEQSVASYIQMLQKWVELPLDKAFTHISRAGMTGGQHNGWSGISPFVIGSVLWSLYSFLRTPDNYWETICTAIAVGGDVDTTAAMAGAISGAYLGLESIPHSLSKRLTDQGTWVYDELVALAHRCYEIKMIQIHRDQ